MRIDMVIARAAAEAGSRAKVAAVLGVAERTLYKWAAGVTVPDLWSAQRLAALADVDVGAIVPVPRGA